MNATESTVKPLTKLSANVNKIALVRNTRTLGIPDVIYLSRIALQAGAQGITVHPRPDGRHARAPDVRELAELLTDWPQAEFNIEGNPFHNLMDFVRDPHTRPDQCTFVPDETGAFTSDHGWDLVKDAQRLKPVIAEARACGVRVSLFMDPLPEVMAMARELGADRVELYTEPYAAAFGTAEQDEVLARYTAAGAAAHSAGLDLNAGHDLNRANLPVFLAAVPGVKEVSIGHALIADALEFGLAQTVRLYLEAIRKSVA